MRGVSLSTLHCSIARTLDVVGERWTLLVLRDAFNGVRRFEHFAARLPIARNVLTDRLQTLVDHGILRRHRYQERPDRYEYRLTEKGMELYPVLIALLQWGDRYLAGEDGPPVDVLHTACGHHAAAAVVCTGCGQTLTARDTRGRVRAATEHRPVRPSSA
ncbi:MAG: winged helix-turn-helix transcriptional regulator [Dehalococcoidia bacterium]